jgi:hypothetical protein
MKARVLPQDRRQQRRSGTGQPGDEMNTILHRVTRLPEAALTDYRSKLACWQADRSPARGQIAGCHWLRRVAGDQRPIAVVGLEAKVAG